MKSLHAVAFVGLVGLFALSTGCGERPAVSQPSTVPSQPIAAQPNIQQPISPQFPAPSPPEDRESIAVEFVEVTSNDRGDFVVLRFTNTTDAAIAGIRGGIHVNDADGNIVYGYGYTDQLFNQDPGASVDLPLLKIKPDGPLQAHRDSLAELSYIYAAQEITFE